MAPRPNWKGYLKLSLVSCPVALYTAASTAERVSFHLVNRKTGNRLRRQMVDPETDEVVDDGGVAKGFEIGKNEHIILEDEELAAVALESTHTIDIEAFVPRKDVDELYLDESYYIVPEDKVGYEAFAVIRDAMAREDLVGLARVVLYRRERLLMLQPRGKGIWATAIRYKNEVRDEEDYFDDIPQAKISKDMLDLAVHILETKKAKFDPSKFEDRYETALKELIKAKQAGKKPPAAPTPEPTNVISLMDALRRSVKEGKRPPAASRAGRTARSQAAPKRTAKRKKLKRAS